MLHAEWAPALRILLALHILNGIVALICAPIALATAKGGRAHRRWGKIYFWAMAVVAVTALALSIALPVLFLALVAVFSFYSAFVAYRILYLKDLHTTGKASAVDWAAAIATFVCSLALAILGIVAARLMVVGLIRIAGHDISIVSVVFGCIGMNTSAQSIKGFVRRPTEKMFWWYGHLQGMIGSYIAALTAFSAVNLSHWFGAAWWVWLWPTMLGVPAITIWTGYYKKKFAGRRAPLTPATV